MLDNQTVANAIFIRRKRCVTQGNSDGATQLFITALDIADAIENKRERDSFLRQCGIAPGSYDDWRSHQ